ncbi:MAG: hypothetical protein FJZ95_02695 [Chloroflexi bacterium]|nr:hypothetical protein [Chloroflexota bacterium]
MARIVNRIVRDERGITGLETAIILIAFIVVASVFAYTVLSAGLFSAQKTEEVIRTGINETESTVQIDGNVVAYKGTANADECVAKFSFTVEKALPGGGSIDLTPFYRIGSNGALVSPMLSECDAAWTSSGTSTITVTTDSSDFKDTPRSNKLTVATAFTTGTMAYYNLPTAMDISYARQISAWVKPSVDVTAGVLRLSVCSGTRAATPVDTLSLPALPASTWTQVTLDLTSPGASTLSSIRSVALTAASDPGAITIWLDEVRTRTSSDTITGKNATMIAYNDENTFIDDVAWTVEFAGGYGTGTNDYLLQNSEKATITVWLQNFDGTSYSNGTSTDDPFIDSNSAHLKTSSMFNVQLMPPEGATLLITKRTPAYLDPIMRLF